MTATAFELFGSRETRANEQTGEATLETRWHIEGSDDELDVRAALLTAAPPSYSDTIINRTLLRRDHSIEQVGPESWEGVVVYATSDGQQAGANGSFSFDTTGGSAHITQALSQTAYGNDPPDVKGAIGVTKDGVAGVDITIPTLKFSETYTFAASAVLGLIPTWAALTGHTNNGTWRGLAAGQALFLGAQGQSQETGDVPVTFNYEIGINASGLNVGGISGIDKTAFQYLWSLYQDEVDDDAEMVVKKPRNVFVATVYPSGDFSSLQPS